MSNSLRPHGLQYTRLRCPSPTPGACSNSCPLSQWCHPTISSSVIPFSSCLQSCPASGSFPMSQFFTSGGQSIGVSASVLPMNIHNWFPLRWTGWISLQSKGLSRVFFCAHQDPGGVTPQEIDSDLPVSVQESLKQARVSSGLLQGWGHWVWHWVHGMFWRRSPLSSLPPPQFCLGSNNRKGTQPHPSRENWIRDLLSMALPIRTRPSFPLRQSLPSGSFHKPLIFIHQRAERMKTTITEN